MRTTVTLDDDLLAKARKYSGVDETSALLRLALKTLIELEASRRLAALGGTDLEAAAGPRKRPMAA
jgi:Arc/MetJ family transcription regulator